jgi:UDP-N-acetylmuramoylalanine--D-glutamate ligase
VKRAVLRVGDQGDARATEQLLLADGWDVQTDGPLDGAGLLVVDEWTPETDPHVVAAHATGVRVTVLAEIILDHLRSPVIAVTGTAGKTSACRALAHVLERCGRPVSISSTARSANAWPDRSVGVDPAPGTVTIAELTSTHLCHMDSVRADVGVVTMLRPDHVDLHGDLDRYYAAKRRLVGRMPASSSVVLPLDDQQTTDILGPIDRTTWGFGAMTGATPDGAFEVDGHLVLAAGGRSAQRDLPATGTTLRAAMAAAAAALALGIDPQAVADALDGLPSVAHRLAARPGPGGITIIDDSMAATPLKAAAGIRQAPAGPLVVVVGGNDAPAGAPVHASPEEVAALSEALLAVRARADCLIAFGSAAQRVVAQVPVDQQVGSLADALDSALSRCPQGGTVMISPMFPLTPDDRARAAGASPSR